MGMEQSWQIVLPSKRNRLHCRNCCCLLSLTYFQIVLRDLRENCVLIKGKEWEWKCELNRSDLKCPVFSSLSKRGEKEKNMRKPGPRETKSFIISDPDVCIKHCKSSVLHQGSRVSVCSMKGLILVSPCGLTSIL